MQHTGTSQISRSDTNDQADTTGAKQECAPLCSETATSAKMDTLGIEPRASRMLSGCDTTTPCAHMHDWGVRCSTHFLEIRGNWALVPILIPPVRACHIDPNAHTPRAHSLIKFVQLAGHSNIPVFSRQQPLSPAPALCLYWTRQPRCSTNLGREVTQIRGWRRRRRRRRRRRNNSPPHPRLPTHAGRT